MTYQETLLIALLAALVVIVLLTSITPISASSMPSGHEATPPSTPKKLERPDGPYTLQLVEHMTGRREVIFEIEVNSTTK